jgi:hypothetical protein
MSYNRSSTPADVVIDIETVLVPPTPEEIQEFKDAWKPKGNATKPETIEAQRVEAFAAADRGEIDGREFSLAGKRMICAAAGTVSKTSRSVIALESWASDDLKDITTGLVDYLDKFDTYNLIGWNHRTFDLPEIAKSFYRTGVAPRSKPGKWGIIDLCAFPFERKGLKATAKGFGLELMDVDGSDVAQLYADRQWDKIREYNEHDVRLTGTIYLIASTIFSF